MPTCLICQHTFKSLKFKTKHIDICIRCVNTLNESPEPAKNAEARFAERLARGIRRNEERNLNSDEEWKRRKARYTLDNLGAAVADKLQDWITKLLKDPKNSTRDFKIMRAYSCKLLRKEGFAKRPSEVAWKEKTQRIRDRDDKKCMACGATNTKLDVHHIIYLSHHGTNSQNNLITLCRTCHEDEHARSFDVAESPYPEPAPLIQHQATQPLPEVPPQSPATPVSAPVSGWASGAALTTTSVLHRPAHDLQPAVSARSIPTQPVARMPPAALPQSPAVPVQAQGSGPISGPILRAAPLPRPQAHGRRRAVPLGEGGRDQVPKWVAILGAAIAGIAVTLLVSNTLPSSDKSHASSRAENRHVTQTNTPTKSEEGIFFASKNPKMAGNSDQQPLNTTLHSQDAQDEQLVQQQKQQATAVHYQKIYTAYPDADSLVAEPGFKRWSAAPERQGVMRAGTTEEVIKLLGDYKKQKIEMNRVRQSDSPAELPKSSETACIFKSIMTDADYRACGISPPSR